MGGLALFVLVTVLGGSLHVQSALAVVVMLYLAFICGAGYVLWALLMKNNPVSRIAIFGFVNPVVNVLLSAVLNGEPLFRWQYHNTIYHPYLSRGKIDPPNPRYNLPEQSVRFRIHAYIPLILRHYYP